MAAKEAKMVFHMIKENHSFRSMTCLTDMMKNVFGQKKFDCGRTKSSAIVSNVFEPMVIEEIKSELKIVQYISVATDSSNHGNTKMFPVLIRYFIPLEGVRTRMIDLVSLPGEKAIQIRDLLLGILEDLGIKNKVAGFCGDNCPTNFGRAITRAGKGNVFYFLREQLNDALIGIGCLAHVLHNAINNACTTVLPHDMEAVIVKIYKQFYIYTERTESLKAICEQSDIVFEQLKSYGGTRFVAMRSCLVTIIKLYDALVEYFEEDKNNYPVILKKFFEDPLARFLLQFLRDACDNFESTILSIEGDKVCGVEALSKALKLKALLEHQLETDFLTISAIDELDKAIKKETANGKVLTKNYVLRMIVRPFYSKIFS